jgi:hypothetical protein
MRPIVAGSPAAAVVQLCHVTDTWDLGVRAMVD